MTIENGATGYNRNDIIYARFLTSGNVDSFILAVKKGTATTGTATDPALVQGNLYEGAVERDYPLYRVKLSGLSIASVDQLFTVIPTIPDLKAQMEKDKAEINQSLTELNTDLNGIKSSLLVRSINPTNISNFNEFNVTLEKVGNIVTCQYAISNTYAFGDIDLFQIPSGYAPRGTCYAWTNRRTSTQESCRNQIYISPTNIKFQNNDGSTTLESWGEFTYTIDI